MDYLIDPSLKYYMNKDILESPKKRILVVDDSPVIRSLLNRKLTKQGFTVIQACTGDEVVELINDMDNLELPQAAIVDREMPGITSGMQCAFQLKQRGVDTVAYTAGATPNTIETYQRQGIPVFDKLEMNKVVRRMSY